MFLQSILIAIGLTIIVTLLVLFKITSIDEYENEHNPKIFTLTLSIVNVYLFAIIYMVFDEFLTESKGIVAPRKLSDVEDNAIYEF